jgi:hypothetical protein
MKRPTGITIIAILYIVLAILSLVWSGGLVGAESVAAFGLSSGWAGFLGIITAVVQLAVAFGLLAMKKWAWILALIGVGLTVVQGVIGLFAGGVFGFMCGGLALIIPVIILIYLLRPTIRDDFGVGTT